MSRRQVTIRYEGCAECDIDEGSIVDALDGKEDDDSILVAIRDDIDSFMDWGDPEPPSYSYDFDTADLIASVRREIARRKESKE